jgi:hypothetical protein
MILKIPGATRKIVLVNMILDNESIASKLWNFKKIQPQLFHLVFHIFIAARVFGFWKIYSVFRKE